jgi:hypothetical protein
MNPQETPTYNPNVPLPKNQFNASQLDFLNNFGTLYNAFAENHVALDATSNAGNHTVIQLLQQDANDQFQTDVGEISIYCKPVTDQGDQIFLRYQGNKNEFQLSAYQIYPLSVLTNPGIVQTPFFSFLPGKVLVYFGTIQCTLSMSGVPLYLRPPIATNIITMNFCLMGSVLSFPPAVSIKTPNSNGFYDTIYLQNPVPFGVQPQRTYFYVVLANI